MANWHWARSQEGDRELRSAHIPHDDGRDYDDNIIPPTVSDIIRQMRTIEANDGVAVKRFVIIAIGKLGSDGRNISGMAKGPVGWRDLRNLQTRMEGFSYYAYMQDLFEASQSFHHIHTIVIRPID